VTSPLETFDISTEPQTSIYTTLGLDGALTQPTTPIFSPIPFLHEDARERSKSPTPLHLDNSLAPGDAPTNALGTKALGLVDELDTPAPGHMSNHPMALTATTDLPGTVPKTLEDRFVKAKEESPPSTSDSESESVGGDDRTDEKSSERNEKVNEGEKDKDESNEDAEVENMILGNDSDTQLS
jgi:serine/threonine-protein phosphatase 4 regulatory subunit 2